MSQSAAIRLKYVDPPPHLSASTFSPADFPEAFTEPLRLTYSEWCEHVPFAMAVIQMTRPSILVELGTQGGVSYCAFCQAIDRLHLNTRAYAVDTWEGDAQTRSYGNEVYESLKEHHDPLYSGFSRLIRGTFDEALQHFDDGSVDLLHIDGYHTFEAVSHDFETWLPKMSKSGVILFHDINVRKVTFGVWKFWSQVRDRYPSFEFHHQHGLGVLAVGSECPAPLLSLCASSPEEMQTVREFYRSLGQGVNYRFQLEKVTRDWKTEQTNAQIYASQLAIATTNQMILKQEVARLEYLAAAAPSTLAKRQAMLLLDIVAPRGTRRRDWLKSMRRSR